MQKSTTTPNHKVEKQSTCQSYSQNIIGVSSGDTTTNNLDPELSLITDKFKQINEEKEKLETGLDDVLAGLTNELDAFMLDSTGPSKPTPTKSTTPVSPKRRVTPKPNISPSFTSKSDTHIEEVDSGFTCTFCNESIIGKWIKIAPEKIYHPLHFKCESKKTKLAGNGICGKVLNESNYKNKDGINHCLSCYNDASAAKCDYCNLSIKDVVKCIQNCVNALGKSFHAYHFFCAQCGKLFESEGELKYMEYEGQAYCEEDYLALFASTCGGCNNPISGEILQAIDKNWHRACLKCNVCDKLFDDSDVLYEIDAIPYCNRHYFEKIGSICCGCNKPIIGKCINALGKRYHENHFNCTSCKKDLTNSSFKGNNGSPYCQACDIQIFG